MDDLRLTDERLCVLDHPLVEHKLSIMRDENTTPSQFRQMVHEISMMMSIALRFIPILLEETDKIMKAQIARGADMESGNLIQKAKAMIPILVPLFVSAFRRANDLAMAMEARCYRGGNGRTKMKPLIYKSADHMAYLITILYVVIAFVVGRYVPFKLWIF